MKCLACDKDFEVTNNDIIPTEAGWGVVTWCSDCDKTLNLGTKKSILASIISTWENADNKLQAALDYADKTSDKKKK